MTTFREFVKERLEETDKYYQRLEELKDESVYLIRSAQFEDFRNNNFIIEINDKSILLDKKYTDFFIYIGIDIEKVTEEMRYVFINGEQKIEYYETLAQLNNENTCVGNIHYSRKIDGQYTDENEESLFVEDKECFVINKVNGPKIQMAFGKDEMQAFDFTQY